jgi:hypothetical protein
MKLEWVLAEHQLRCDAPRSFDSDVICELPWDHMVLQIRCLVQLGLDTGNDLRHHPAE